MRFPLLIVVIVLVVNGFIDLCIYRAIKHYYRSRWLAVAQGVSSVLLSIMLLVAIFMPKRAGADSSLLGVMWMLYTYMTFYVSKYIFIIFHLIARLPQLWHHKPFKPISVAGAVIAVATFVLMWWGALINRFNIQVVETQVPVAGLPEAFDGFRIAQISDLHVGTFGTDTAFVSKLVDRVNEQHPDLIVFTGDIVNRHSEEFPPFMQVMSRLHAPYGVYSVMGNHDYGDYCSWPSDAEKERDVMALKEMEGLSGMHMLNNSSVWLRAGSDSIALIGVENIGDPPFKTYGDLHKAYPEIDDPNVKILLSHNPAHWEHDIEDAPTNIALTLSGHTHAMQMEVLGLSPAALRYDKWGGLYTDHRGQALYVNIGAGTVGMPYRIGATPEITVLTLTPKIP